MEQVTGHYFHGLREARAESQAYNRQARSQLRQLSEQLTGLTGSRMVTPVVLLPDHLL